MDDYNSQEKNSHYDNKMNDIDTLLVCPLCQFDLQKAVNRWLCQNGHSFDISKENYTNLLLVNAKNSKSPGDNKTAASARQAFLANAYYEPIVELINQVITNQQTEPKQEPKTKPLIVDAGCGEGYYLAALIEKNPQYLGIGFDISKASIRLAAKHRKSCHWFVASSKSLPLKKASIDVLLHCFSPFFENSIRLVKPGGLIIFINGAADHLQEMRQLIYKEKQVHQFTPKVPDNGITLLAKQRLQYQIKIHTTADLRNLINMTPHQFKSSSDKQDAFVNAAPIALSVDIIAYIYRVDA